MTGLPIAVSQAGVGRPPLAKDIETKPTMVRLTADIRDRIAALVGPNRMAIFIRTAIEAELARREQPAAPDARARKAKGAKGK